MNKMLLWIAPALMLLAGCGKNPPKAAAENTGNTENAAARAPEKPRIEAAAIHIPAGTLLRVRLAQAIDTSRDRAGERFEATLASPVSMNGKTVLPVGTRFNGHLTTSQSSGRLRGRGYLGLTLDSFELNGRRHAIHTSSSVHATGSHNKRNLALIGGGSGVGALIGGLAGGGKGAAIGAASGAAAGTAGAAATGKKNVHLPAETLLSFSLKAPVQVQAAAQRRTQPSS